MKQSLHLLALVGMPGAGKSFAADFFRSHDIPVLRFGDQVDIGLKEHNLELNEKNERWYREKVRAELGMAAMAIKIEPRILKIATSKTHVVLDGLYSWEEYIFLKEKFKGVLLLCIWAPPKVRYERLSKRKIRPLTNSEAESRDRAEIQNLNKGGPIAMADYVIKNERDESSFFSSLEEFITSVWLI